MIRGGRQPGRSRTGCAATCRPSFSISWPAEVAPAGGSSALTTLAPARSAHALTVAAPISTRRCATLRPGGDLMSMLVSLGDDPVGPLHQPDENRGVAELRAPLGKILLGDAASARARAARVDLDLPGRHFLQRFHQRRPADRNDRVRDRGA